MNDFLAACRSVFTSSRPRSARSRRAATNVGAIRQSESLETRSLLTAVRLLPGFESNVLPANDDDSTAAVPIGFGIDFFGDHYDSLHVNNNGNITFGSPLGDWTPDELEELNVPIIAPFWADVDTRATGSGEVTYGSEIVDGRSAFGVNWLGVGYFFENDTPLNSFQLLLIDRSDVEPYAFDVEFNYNTISWETGDADGGVNGLGGTSARAGFSNGSAEDGTFYELIGSGENGAFLDSNTTTGLAQNYHGAMLPGRYVFEFRAGSALDEYGLIGQSVDFGSGFIFHGEGINPLDVSIDAPTNAESIDTSNADEVRAGGSAGLNLNGNGIVVGVVEASEGANGALAQTTHVELAANTTTPGATPTRFSNHATHVSGTIAAAGVNAAAGGFAPSATVQSYGIVSGPLGVTPAQAANLNITNHSYGFVGGWTVGNEDINNDGVLTPAEDLNNNGNIDSLSIWNADRSTNAVEDPRFGVYSTNSQNIDTFLVNAPNLLSVFAAGNDGSDQFQNFTGTNQYRSFFSAGLPGVVAPAPGSTAGWYTVVNAGATAAPGPDGNGQNRAATFNNFDNLPWGGQTAKNTLVVGAVTEVTLEPTDPGYAAAVNGTQPNFSDGFMSTFSDWGPTDDGRMGVDIVANGVAVNSPISNRQINAVSQAIPAATPIIITLPNHGLATGATVTTAGIIPATAADAATVAGNANANANGTFVITVINANTFSLNGTTRTANWNINRNSVVSANNFYASFQGTSMAAPSVAGQAALIAQHFANVASPSFPLANRTSATMKGLITHNAIDVFSPGPDYRTGWGLANARGAVDFVTGAASGNPRSSVSNTVVNELTTGTFNPTLPATTTVTVDLVQGTTYKGTLVWTDPAGTGVATGPGATADNQGAVLVNNLNLSVTAPDGTTVFNPWVLNPAAPGAAATRTNAQNNVDNIEQVLFNVPTTGTYTVTVGGTVGVAGTTQNFSLLETFTSPAMPPSFGNVTSTTDGLHPTSDSGVPAVVATLTDRVTSVTTPTFFGEAAPNTLVSAYLDVDVSGTITAADILLGQNTAVPTVGPTSQQRSRWQLTSLVDLNSAAVLAAMGAAMTPAVTAIPRDGVRQILISGQDPSGATAFPSASTPQQVLQISLDTQGPQVVPPTGLQAIQVANAAPQGTANGVNNYNLFTGRNGAGTLAPTPAVNGLIINVRDLPNQTAAFVRNTIQNLPGAPAAVAPLSPSGTAIHSSATLSGSTVFPLNTNHFGVAGAATGAAPILSAYFVNTSAAVPPAAPANGYIVLTFRSATGGATLPDDRFTLTVNPTLLDPAGNALDGEYNGINVTSGNGQAGGAFSASFSVDSRPEAAVFGQNGVFVDANANWTFDPNNTDPANRDLAYTIGINTDFIFAGQFSAGTTAAARGGVTVPAGTGTNNGYDKLGAYGLINGAYRWLLDTTDNGVADTVVNQAVGFTVNGITFTGNGFPFAGNFAGGAGSADEVGIFDGVNWFLDTAAPWNVISSADTAFTGTMRGFPVAGDFDGDGVDDLATHLASTNLFQFDYGSTTLPAGVRGRTGNADATITFGFPGVLERPVAGDTNLDGIDDIGLAVPNQGGLGSVNTKDWYILQSVGASAPGTNTNLNHPFSTVPGLGPDLFRQFGGNLSAPLLGNFDPPPLVSENNLAPLLQAPALAHVSESSLTATIDISIVDQDGDAVTVTTTADSLAWYMDQTLGLKSNGNYWQDYFGENEVWIQDADNKWYFITETGGLFRWDGRKSTTGTLIALLDDRYHADPDALINAERDSVPVQITSTMSELTVTRDAGFADPYVVTVTADDGQMTTSAQVMVDSMTGAAARLDSELELYTTGNYWENWGGIGEKWLRASNGQWYFITPDGTFRSWDRKNGASGPEVVKLDPAFHENAELLIDAAEISLAQKYGFRASASEFFDWGGRQEKWFRGDGNSWFFVLDTGDIYRWDRTGGASGDLVGRVDAKHYAQPSGFYAELDDVFRDWTNLMGL